MEEVKFKVTEKHEFDNRYKSIQKAFHGSQEYQQFGGRFLQTDVSIENCGTCGNLPIDTFMKEVQPVVTENEEFECLEKSFFYSFHGRLRQSRFLCGKQNPQVFEQFLCQV